MAENLRERHDRYMAENIELRAEVARLRAGGRPVERVIVKVVQRAKPALSNYYMARELSELKDHLAVVERNTRQYHYAIKWITADPRFKPMKAEFHKEMEKFIKSSDQ